MLDKSHRLNKHGSFAFVYRNGKRLSDTDLVLFYTPAKTARVGFSVSNKVGKAVVRNKVKRRLRASVAAMMWRIKGCQAVVSANSSAASKEFSELDEEVLRLFTRAGLIK